MISIKNKTAHEVEILLRTNKITIQQFNAYVVGWNKIHRYGLLMRPFQLTGSSRQYFSK